MSYPGNAALSREIRQRILETFDQTLGLANVGSKQEALLGCDFILRLDPLFEPARVLQERLASTTGGVPVDDLRIDMAAALEGAAAEVPATDSPLAAAESELGSLEGLSLDLDSDLEPFETSAQVPTSADEPAATLPDLESIDEAPGLEFGEEPAGESPAATTFDLEPPSLLDEAPEEPAMAPTPPTTVVGPGPEPSLDRESEGRIAALLDEGQTAFDAGSFQAAIDAWSRIFLIDIDHSEANERIDQARKLKAEVERKVEEAYHEGVAFIEKGDLERARKTFETVLELQPHHLAAKEYLDKIDRGDVAAPGTPAAAPVRGGAAAAPAPGAETLSVDLEPEDLAADAIEPPAAARRAPGPKKEKAGGLRRAFVLIGSGVLLLVIVGGWLLYSNWNRIFPNSAAEARAQPSQEIDPLDRARSLHEDGKTPIAIAQLRRLPPDSPQYAEAQSLIAQWETRVPEEEATSEEISAADVARWQELVDAAHRSAEAGAFIRASELLEQAAAIAPLGPEVAPLEEQIREELSGLERQLGLFKQGDWEYALPELWRLREAEPGSPDIDRLIADSYYNLGVRDLQRGDTIEAARKFNESLDLRPDDTECQRLASFATSYQHRAPDLLFRIYVKYLPFR